MRLGLETQRLLCKLVFILSYVKMVVQCQYVALNKYSDCYAQVLMCKN